MTQIFNKIKGYHNHQLLNFFKYFNIIGLFVGIYILINQFTWYYLLVTIISIICISKIGHSIGQHRYFCHLSFKTTEKKDWLIAFFATLSTTGSIIHYAGVHRYHHLNSDKPNDLHSPHEIGFIKTFFLRMDKEKLEKIPPRIIKDLLKRKSVMFFHDWYWPTILIYITTLFFIDPLLVVFCYIIPAGYSKFISGIQLSVVHLYGYRNFETSDKSTNNIFWNFITLGEGLHNNHHARPGEYDFSFTKKPFEYDFAGFLIKKLLIST